MAEGGGTRATQHPHPVPESNLVSESKRSFPQQSHRYMPSSLQSWYWPENGLSVPLRLHTQNCSGVSSCFPSSSDFDTFLTMRHTSNGLRDRRLWKAHGGDGPRPRQRRPAAVLSDRKPPSARDRTG